MNFPPFPASPRNKDLLADSSVFHGIYILGFVSGAPPLMPAPLWNASAHLHPWLCQRLSLLAITDTMPRACLRSDLTVSLLLSLSQYTYIGTANPPLGCKRYRRRLLSLSEVYARATAECKSRFVTGRRRQWLAQFLSLVLLLLLPRRASALYRERVVYTYNNNAPL